MPDPECYRDIGAIEGAVKALDSRIADIRQDVREIKHYSKERDDKLLKIIDDQQETIAELKVLCTTGHVRISKLEESRDEHAQILDKHNVRIYALETNGAVSSALNKQALAMAAAILGAVFSIVFELVKVYILPALFGK